jgi:TRAP-type C4-dicarboxylate transport system substrate-binding protein
MYRRHFVAGAAAATMLAGSARADTLTFKLGTNDTPESPTGHSVRVFAAEVDRLSNGAMKVAIFDNSALGTNATQIQNVIAGAQDMHLLYPQFLANFIEQAKWVPAPYLFNDLAQMQRFYRSKMFAPAVERLRAIGAEIIDPDWTWMVQDPQGLLTKKPVFAPDDLAGMKVRSTDDSTTLALWRGMGASPIVIARGQVYIALTQNLVSATAESIGVAYDLKDVEVAKYWTRTDAINLIVNVLMNGARYAALDDTRRQILHQAMRSAGQAFAAETLRASEDKKAIAREKFGVAIIEPDPAPWRSKGQTILAALEASGAIPKGTAQAVQNI